MVRIPVTTAIDAALWERAKKSGLKWTQLIQLGVNAADRKDIGEADRLREENAKLAQKIQKLAGRIFVLENPELGAQE